MKRIRYANFVLGLGILLLLLVVINGYYVIRYIRVKDNIRWPRGAFEYSSLMGYEMSPGFSSKMLDGTFSISSHVFGYRIPISTDQIALEPGGVMSIGCSFTYGDSVEAEQTFTWLLANKLGLPAYNYGLCSSSYATMIMRLKLLKEKNILPELKPRILILGAGNWLVDRSLSPFIPSGSNIAMVFPYIIKKHGCLQIHSPPDFFSLRHIFFLESKSLPSVSKSWGDIKYFACFCNMALLVPRIFLLNVWKIMFRRPDINSSELYDFVIGEIKRIIAPYGTQFVILWMPDNEYDTLDNGLKKALRKHPDVILINGAQELKRYGVAASCYSGIHPQWKAHEAYANGIFLHLPEHLKK